ncbi:CPBP family intramembrane glutamic endopeptidase [Algoriphagus machipongonensis]|uniref:Membrane protein n=1 Tax=Algoriphagus machipongonensis TaxID=388413 RepID=A3I2I9_9BACT|nr:type II CAAX endopeptidase family protein [Algoriphagus machipongonensis]EAZ79293.1 membrane protein [Algoriphagus machipongonensis]
MTETIHKQLTIKRGILAIVVMYACQLLAGIIISYGFKFFSPNNEVPIEILGLTSALLSGIMIITFFWWDIRKSGEPFYPEIGLQKSKIKKSKGLLLVLSALILTHFLAWIYRSLILPALGHEGIIGGGSKMFSYIKTNGGSLEMSGFLLLALLVGPIMEEVVFRGYLQSSLAKKIPSWAAILITSIVFTVGHNPMILWPMYFLYSATWGWILLRTGSLKMAILIHVLSNLFYAVVGFAGWDILA